MYITVDLKKRLKPEFFTRLVAQLKSASKPILFASCTSQDAPPAALLDTPFDAGLVGLRMAALET